MAIGRVDRVKGRRVGSGENDRVRPLREGDGTLLRDGMASKIAFAGRISFSMRAAIDSSAVVCSVQGGRLMDTFTLHIQIPEALRELGYNEEEIRRELPVLLVLQRI